MSRKLEYEFVKNEIEKRGWKLLSQEYLGVFEKMNVICSNGHELSIRFNDFFYRGTGCTYCSKKDKKTIEFIKNEFQKRDWIVLSKEYFGAHIPIDAMCPNGYKTKISWANFQSGKGCGYCCGQSLTENNRLDVLFPDIAKEFSIKNIKPIEDIFYSENKKYLWECSKCGYEWITSPNSRTNMKSGCPWCNESKGETLVCDILNELNIYFERQVRFDDCRNKNPLPFDFMVPFENNYFFLIEFQGSQHYLPKDFGGRGLEYAKKQLEYVQNNDSIKRNYCFENNIPFVEIPYWMKPGKIKELLIEKLNL